MHISKSDQDHQAYLARVRERKAERRAAKKSTIIAPEHAAYLMRLRARRTERQLKSHKEDQS